MSDEAQTPASPNDLSQADKMAGLKLQVDLSNSEKQAIWTRHGTMIVGNGLILNAIKASPMPTSYGVFLFNLCGLALCVTWGVMTWVGWGWFYKAMIDSVKLVPDDRLNPFASFPGLANRKTDKVFHCAMLVVGIFAAFYLVGLRPFVILFFQCFPHVCK